MTVPAYWLVRWLAGLFCSGAAWSANRQRDAFCCGRREWVAAGPLAVTRVAAPWAHGSGPSGVGARSGGRGAAGRPRADRRAQRSTANLSIDRVIRCTPFGSLCSLYTLNVPLIVPSCARRSSALLPRSPARARHPPPPSSSARPPWPLSPIGTTRTLRGRQRPTASSNCYFAWTSLFASPENYFIVTSPPVFSPLSDLNGFGPDALERAAARAPPAARLAPHRPPRRDLRAPLPALHIDCASILTKNKPTTTPSTSDFWSRRRAGRARPRPGIPGGRRSRRGARPKPRIAHGHSGRPQVEAG